MPVPPPKGETNPDVEIMPSETTTTKEPAKEVELDASTGKPVEPPVQREPSVSAEEFRKLQARFEYRERQAEKRERELMDRFNSIASNQAPNPVINPTEKLSDEEIYGLKKNELNTLGADDWTKPVTMISEKVAEKIAERKFKEMIEAREKAEQEARRQQTNMTILEKEKNWVLERVPSLNDETSEEFKGFYATYNRLISEDQTLVSNPRAPRLVYYEWMAERNSKETAVPPDPEKERLKRVAGGISPQGRPSTSGKTIRLTQEELDLCNRKGISPAVYAMTKESNLKEGVSA